MNRFAKNGSFWVDGTMVYTVIVVVCNLKILHKSNNITWVSYFLIFGSILFYELWFGLESTSTWFPQVYKMFDELMRSKDAWFIILLTTWFNYGQHILFNNLEIFLERNGKSEVVKGRGSDLFAYEAGYELSPLATISKSKRGSFAYDCEDNSYRRMTDP